MGCGNSSSSSAASPAALPDATKPAEFAESGFSKESTIIRAKDDFYNYYTLEERLGAGSLSEIWKVKHKKTGQVRAVKIIKKNLNRSSQMVGTLVNAEVESLAKLDSPNIEKIYEVFEDKYKYYIVNELLKGPTLMKYIEKAGKNSINERTVAGYVKEILLGLSHCHAMNILHRDVLPDNIIFADEKNAHVKLVDFKLAKVYGENDKAQEVLGAPAYIAPEVLSKRMYTPKADIWSCGITTYFLLSGNLPFAVTPKMPLSELAGIIQANKFTMASFKDKAWERVSDAAKKFLLKMLDANPETRASAEELLKDPWLSNTAEAPVSDDAEKVYLTNMRRSLADQKFEHAVMMYIVNRAELENQKESLLQLFSKMDKNGDQKLSKEELKNGFKESGIVLSSTEFDQLFKKLDADKNGSITYTEYLTGAVDVSMLVNEKSLEDAFKFLDKDNKGHLLKSSLKDAMGKNWLSEFQLNQLFSEVDSNKDDKITLSEFKTAMKAIAAKKSVTDKLKSAAQLSFQCY